MFEKYTYGVDINGISVLIDTYLFWISIIDKQLVSLEIPKGVKRVDCSGNYLTDLKIPDSVNLLICDRGVVDIDTCKVEAVYIIY
jgi:hypothetical protein